MQTTSIAARPLSLAERDSRYEAERLRIVALIPKDEAPLSHVNHIAIRKADLALAVMLAMRIRRGEGTPISKDERRQAEQSLREARQLLIAVERDLVERTHARYLARIAEEIIWLETGRGEEVREETVDDLTWVGHGVERVLATRRVTRLRILTRDGLSTLGLSAPRFAAGMRYRAAYEKADPERGLKAVNWEPTGGASHGGDNWEDARLGWAKDVALIERKVYAAGALHKRGDLWVQVLRQVAGQGLPISKAVKGARARERWRQALDPALDVVAAYLGIT